MYGQTGRFIDDEKVIILVDDVECFRDRGLYRSWTIDEDLVTAVNAMGGLEHDIVRSPNFPFDQPLELRS